MQMCLSSYENETTISPTSTTATANPMQFTRLGDVHTVSVSDIRTLSNSTLDYVTGSGKSWYKAKTNFWANWRARYPGISIVFRES